MRNEPEPEVKNGDPPKPDSPSVANTSDRVARPPRTPLRERVKERLGGFSMKWLNAGLKLAILIALGTFGVIQVYNYRSNQLTKQVNALEEEKSQLVEFADRLKANRRVAQIDVVKQYELPNGEIATALLWQEVRDRGVLGTPVALEVRGDQVYFEGRVIKFDHQYIEREDPHRGASLVMFRRIFGNRQTPDSGFELDRSAGLTFGEDRTDLEKRLWGRFWELASDPALAKRYGVRVAQCEAPSVRVEIGEVWEASLDSSGGLNLRKLGRRSTAHPLMIDPDA